MRQTPILFWSAQGCKLKQRILHAIFSFWSGKPLFVFVLKCFCCSQSAQKAAICHSQAGRRSQSSFLSSSVASQTLQDPARTSQNPALPHLPSARIARTPQRFRSCLRTARRRSQRDPRCSVESTGRPTTVPGTFRISILNCPLRSVLFRGQPGCPSDLLRSSPLRSSCWTRSPLRWTLGLLGVYQVYQHYEILSNYMLNIC